MAGRRTWMWLLGFAFAYRLFFLLFSSESFGGDEFYYLWGGLLFARGYTPYVDYSYHPGPLFLLAMAAPHMLLDRPWFLARVLTCLVDSANVALIYLLGVRLVGGRPAVVASLIYLLHPLSVFVAATTMSEPYILLPILAGLYLLSGGRPLCGWGSFFLVASVFVKYWAFVFWLPAVVYLMRRRLPRHFPLWLLMWCILLAAPFAGWFGGMWRSLEHYLAGRSSFTFVGLAPNLGLLFMGVCLLQFYVMWEWRRLLDVRGWSLHHAWFMSAPLLILFPSLYDHHLTLILPAGALVASERVLAAAEAEAKWVLGSGRMPAYVPCLIILAFAAAYFYTLVDSGFGIAPYNRDAVEDVCGFIAGNTGPGDRILEDLPFCEYFSEAEGLLRGDWVIANRADLEGVKKAAGEARFVVVTERVNGVSTTFPPGSVEYFNRAFCVRKRAMISPAEWAVVYGRC